MPTAICHADSEILKILRKFLRIEVEQGTNPPVSQATGGVQLDV